ncbi:hypothetical protein F0562_027682 [Nyssa sinensis]|uniref:Annexin n=1 Tax=Nyssa sinensis TaxID=561372 RepID=A0A5J5BA50_9ASTE|nr:hypothetical protein F0562_027682 [Nyssa sinensis]
MALSGSSTDFIGKPATTDVMKFGAVGNGVTDDSRLLVLLVSSYRYEGDEVNMTFAKSEAKILHEKISQKAYSHEDVIRILATRSKAQINATLNHCKNQFGNDINKVSYTTRQNIYSESICGRK